MKYAAITVMALAITAPAAYAQSSTTTCNAMGSTLNCHTQQQPGIDWSLLHQQPQQPDYSWIGQMMERKRAEKEAKLRASQEASRMAMEQQRLQLAQTRREAIGAMIAGGHCPEAINQALQWGELEMAEKAKGICAGPPHP